MKEYKKYLKEILEPLYADAEKIRKAKLAALRKRKIQLAKQTKDPVAKAQANTMRKLEPYLGKPVNSDEEVLKQVGVQESLEDNQFLEATGFIKHLQKAADITKEKAEHIWNKAKAVYKKSGKEIKDKYAYIAGIAKKMAGLKEDGEGGAMATGSIGAGSAMNTTQSIGGNFAAKLGEFSNEPGKYSPNPSNIFTRYSAYGKKKKKKKSRKEAVETFVDSLFE